MRRFGIMLVILSMAAAVGVWSGEKRAMAADNRLENINQQFIGHYELVSYVTFDADGTERDMNYLGRITYDGKGNMTAQGMPKDLPARAAASSENVRGGFAYWGSVHFDLDNNIVVHKVEGSPTRGNWVGEDNIRHFEFADGFLKLSIKDETGRTTGTLTWRKYTE
jgi:hypothetical protein